MRLSLNSATASGRTTPVAVTGRRSRSRPACTSAGSEAIDERVLAATSCAGGTPRAKSRSETRPMKEVTG